MRARSSFPHSRLLPALLAATLLAACSSPDGKGGTLVLSSLTQPESLHPLRYRDTVSNSLGRMIFNGLVTVNRRLEPVGDLAESWEVSADGLVWEFRLREGVRFHDGEDLSSADVAFTYRAVLDPSRESPLGPLLGVIREVQTPDERTVRFLLSEPYAPLQFLLNLEILPAHLLAGGAEAEDAFARAPVGTGPFRFVSWDEEALTLEANDGYFEGRPNLDRVVLRVVADKELAWAELMQGGVDVAMDLEPADYRVIAGDPRFRVYDYLEVFYYTVLYNLRDPLFSDARMREAVDLCLDRQDLIDHALEGAGVPTTGPFRPGTWPYDPEVPAALHDPAAGAALLEAMGWTDEDGDMILERKGEELGFVLLADRGDSLKTAVASRVKWQLFQAGIRVEVVLADQQDLFSDYLFPGSFQAVLLQFNAGGDPDKYTYLFWHSSQIGRSNLGAYADPEVDRLIELGRTTSDHEERTGIYHRIHRRIAEERPASFLFFRQKFTGISARFGGVVPAPENFYRSIRDWYVQTKPEERR